MLNIMDPKKESLYNTYKTYDPSQIKTLSILNE